MIDFSDKPYRYFPPRRFGPTTWLLMAVNNQYYLPRIKMIRGLDVDGFDALHGLHAAGDRLVFMPNHPTHADPPIWVEAVRRAGFRTQVMAAYDVFLRSRLNAWVMQRLDVFSIDRDGSDTRGLSQARQTLLGGAAPLTIFPEGNVYLQNDLVTPFHEGAAMVGLRAARELGKQAVRLWAVPVSIKVTHVTDVREAVMSRLVELERAIDIDPTGDASPYERLVAVGGELLRRNLQHRGTPPPEGESLTQRINSAAEAVLGDLERKMQVSPKAKDSLMGRVRLARRRIHELRLDDKKIADQCAAGVWNDQAMLAMRILSYDGAYVESNPTLDRFAETVQKLGEDVHNHVLPPYGPRHAFVRFGEPVSVSDHLGEKPRVALRAITETVESRVQTGLDALNEENTHPGGTVRVG